MKALFMPRLLDRDRYDSWRQAGAQGLYQRSNQEAKRILSEHQVFPKPDNIIEEINQLLESGK